MRLCLRLWPSGFGLNLSRSPLELIGSRVAAVHRLRSWTRDTRQGRWRRAVRNHRTRIHGHCRPAFIRAVELSFILRRLTPHLHLRRHGRIALFMEHRNLRRSRLRLHAAAPAIEAHAVHHAVVHHHIVDHHVMHIHVVDRIYVHVVDCGVVEEVIVVPVPAVVSITGISVAVVDAAVEPDVQPPEPVMEAVISAHKSPVSRRPQRTHIGCRHPVTRDPVVSSLPPRPVARSPEVIRVRCRRLIVIRQRRRRLSRLNGSQIARIRIDCCSPGCPLS